MNLENKIDYVEIQSRDIPQSKAFFRDLLGWQFEDYGPEYAAFDDGRIKGGFYLSNKTSSTESGGVLIVFYAENLEKMSEKVKSLGGNIVKEIFSFPGGRRFQFKEPGGSEFAVWSDQ